MIPNPAALFVCAVRVQHYLLRCFGLAEEQVGRSLPRVQRGRGKSEHYRAASPLTAGRPRDFRFEILTGDDKCNREQTSHFEISNVRSQMGSTRSQELNGVQCGRHNSTGISDLRSHKW